MDENLLFGDFDGFCSIYLVRGRMETRSLKVMSVKRMISEDNDDSIHPISHRTKMLLDCQESYCGF